MKWWLWGCAAYLFHKVLFVFGIFICSCGFAAAVTTPLDVAKTRIMLAKAGSRTAHGNVLSALRDVWKIQGISGLFAGLVPRISAISLGGFIFLGMYDKARRLLL